MKCATTTIPNKLGMHARASAKFVNLAATFDSIVTLEKNGQRVNGKSIMGIMMLAAAKGQQIIICAEGPDEDQSVEQLSELVNNYFGEAE